MKVLVVDDSKLIRSIIRNNLEQLKIKSADIYEAMDGTIGMRYLANLTEHDLIITDLEMPKMNGLEFVQRVKTNKKLEKIKIVACSSALNEGNVATLSRFGVRDLVRKPFDAEGFMTAIKPVIDEVLHNNQGDNNDRFVDIRAEFLNAFKERKPDLDIEDNDMHFKFREMDFRISIDHLLKNSVISYKNKK